ncbi:hypothetical protein [Nitrosomonas supralitoralis]|uniref:hypothetical protein n=1 Tax=Nitrosomonas supralitoralis TaxID=2116706 RepID=UPI001559355E|nr:hypothetical protein [Nitrosomonas supralitoralis]
MQKFRLLSAIIVLIGISGCITFGSGKSGPEGPQGPQGEPGAKETIIVVPPAK